MPRKKRRKLIRNWEYVSVKKAPNIPPDDRLYLPLSLAAAMVGVSPQAIRMKLKEIAHWKPQKGATLVSVEDTKEVFPIF